MSFKKKREIHFFTTGSPENVNHTLSFSIEKCESHSLLIMNWCITLLTYIELVNHTLYFWSAHWLILLHFCLVENYSNYTVCLAVKTVCWAVKYWYD